MIDLRKIWLSGFTRRWHSHPDLRDTVDPIDGHGSRVAKLIIALNPDADFDLLLVAITHDDGESVVGDLPGPYLRKASFRGDFIWDEFDARKNIWAGTRLMDSRSDQDDILWLRLADRLDAYLWAQHHAPHVLQRLDWREAWLEILGLAETLGVHREVQAIEGARS